MAGECRLDVLLFPARLMPVRCSFQRGLFAWLCRQRKTWPASADVWTFRRHWPAEKATLQRELRTGTYQMGLLTRTTLATGEDVDLWAARDALVIKALTLVLQPVLPVSPHCTHLRGNDG